MSMSEVDDIWRERFSCHANESVFYKYSSVLRDIDNHDDSVKSMILVPKSMTHTMLFLSCEHTVLRSSSSSAQTTTS